MTSLCGRLAIGCTAGGTGLECVPGIVNTQDEKEALRSTLLIMQVILCGDDSLAS